MSDTTPTLIWSKVDADDRYPGLYPAYVTETVIDGITYRATITPGDSDSYVAPGFHAAVESISPEGRWSVRGRTLSETMGDVLRDMADDAYAIHTADYLTEA